MKNYLITLIAGLFFTFASYAQIGCGGAGTTPTSTQSCADFDAITATSGSSPCAGAGHGGSGFVRIIKFCTDASSTCVSFDFSGLSSADGSATSLYTGCSGGALSGYVSGSAACYGSTSTVGWSTAGLTLSPNTCYYLRVWTKNAPTSTSTYCMVADPATGDLCPDAVQIGTTALSYDNYCMTAGTAGDPTAATFCAGSLENNMWFDFTTSPTCTAPCTVVVTISGIVCGGGGQGFQIGYYTGSCGSLTNIGCTSGSGGTVTATITNLTPGQVVTVGIDGNAGAFCSFSISATNVVPLPVELAEFETKVNGNSKVDLFWSTFSETENDYFTVERSEDGLNFEFLELIDGAGNSNSLINYSTRDNSPLDGVSYYRLKQTNYDGEYAYSQIKSVQMFPFSANDFLIYPNPTEGSSILSLVGNSNESMEVSVFDLSGKMVYTKTAVLNSDGKSDITLPSYAAGLYMVQVTNKYGKKAIQKFVVN